MPDLSGSKTFSSLATSSSYRQVNGVAVEDSNSYAPALVILAGVRSPSSLSIYNRRVIPPEPLVVQSGMVFSYPAVTRCGPDVFLHTSVTLLFLGDIAVQLGDLVTGQELGMAAVNAVRLLYLLHYGRGGFAFLVTFQYNLAHLAKAILWDGLDEAYIHVDPLLHQNPIQFPGVVVIHQVDAEGGLNRLLPFPDAQLPCQLCHGLDLVI